MHRQLSTCSISRSFEVLLWYPSREVQPLDIYIHTEAILSGLWVWRGEVQYPDLDLRYTYVHIRNSGFAATLAQR